MVALRAIVAAGHDVALVISRADKRRGRHEPPRPSPVKAAALELGLTVSDRPEDAAEVGAELGVVVAFGRIIKPDVLDRLSLVNAHFSLLPRWRGAAPVERAILAGDPTTGVCLMAIDEGLDTGPVYRCDRGGHRTRRDGVRTAGPPGDAGRRAAGRRPGPGPGAGRRPRWARPTYADKIEPADLHLDWSRPAVAAAPGGAARAGLDHLAGATPAGPGRARSAAAPAGDGPPGRLAGEVVATGRAACELLTVQPEGRGPMAAADWVRGARPGPDERLGP